MTPPVSVIQSDRDAAWPFRPEGYGPCDREAWFGGRYDDCASVSRLFEAFASHRIASQEDLVEALEQLVANAELAKAHLPNTEEAGIVSSALFDTISQARAALSRVKGDGE